nr:sigma-54-dependent Fis family transcriptional regulator [Desulfobulbaceae bacterium]
MNRILVVDDDQTQRIALFEGLSKIGYEVAVAENGVMGLELLQKESFALVVTDIRMPEMNGLEFMQKIKMASPGLPVIVVTAFATVDTAIEAMKKGASDYILKPFPVEVIQETVKRTIEKVRLDSVLVGDGQNADSVFSGHDISQKSRSQSTSKPIVGKDPGWLKVVEKAKAVASSKATVLILGESGTGKEVLARYLHTESERSGGPFIALNCAALPDGLLESELFGHEKGAFTGAVVAKKGKFEYADGGTLLLDEIGEVPLHLQAKLLRVLQEEEVDRLGGKAPVKFDVHVLATTNRNLLEAVEKGEFRQDLFYRLNVIPLNLPSLCERKVDIPLLTDFFIKRYSERYKKDVKSLSERSLEKFLCYAWPGNVREMENMIERAVLLSQGPTLEPWDLWDEGAAEYMEPVESPVLPASQPEASSDGSVAQVSIQSGEMIPLREVERQMIMQALHKTDNNRTHAAKMLGISVRTLRNKLNEYRTKGFSV